MSGEVRGYFSRRRVPTDVGERSRTKQSMQEECDINAIMRRYVSTGILEHQAMQAPRYGDFSNADDYLAAVNKVKAAQARFDALPSEVRDHVGNEPAELLRMVYDPERREEMVQLGLLPEPEEDPPEVVEPVKPAEPVPAGTEDPPSS